MVIVWLLEEFAFKLVTGITHTYSAIALVVLLGTRATIILLFAAAVGQLWFT